MNFQPLLAITFIFSLVCLQGCDPPEFPKVVLEDAQKKASHLIKTASPTGRIAVVSHSTLNVKYIDVAIDNHHRYVNKFGYDYIFRNNLLTERFFDKTSHTQIFQLGLYWQKI